MASLRLLAAGASAVGAGALSTYYLTSDSPVSVITFNVIFIFTTDLLLIILFLPNWYSNYYYYIFFNLKNGKARAYSISFFFYVVIIFTTNLLSIILLR